MATGDDIRWEAGRSRQHWPTLEVVNRTAWQPGSPAPLEYRTVSSLYAYPEQPKQLTRNKDGTTMRRHPSLAHPGGGITASLLLLFIILGPLSVAPVAHAARTAGLPHRAAASGLGAGPGTAGHIGVSGSTSAASVQIGARITLQEVITSDVSLSNVHVLIDVFPQGSANNGPKTYGCAFDGQNFSAGVGQTFSCVYTPPQGTQTGGEYLNGGVFSSDYGTGDGYVNDVAAFTITPAPMQTRSADVTIDPSQTVAAVTPDALGTNSAVFDGQLLSMTTTQFLADANVRAIRYPGGSTADVFDWRTTAAQAGTVGCGSTTPYVNAADTFTATEQLARQVGGNLWITVNYGSGTPSEAADWVRDANVQNGYGVRNWEIGNEIYFANGTNGCGEWDQYTPNKYDAASYISNAPAYIAAMRAVDRSIKIAIPVDYDDASSGNTGAWSGQVIQGLCGQFDTLDVHPYAQQPRTESDSGLLAYSPQKIAQTMGFFRSLLQSKCPANAANVNIQIGEVNSVTYNPGKQTVSVVNSLFLADDELTWLEQGASAVQPWDLRNGVVLGTNNSTALFGSLYTDFGDYGALASSYRPRGTPSDYPPGDTRFPAAAAEQLAGALVAGGGRLVSIPGQPANLSVHAVARPDGSLAFLLINRDMTYTQQVTVHLPGYTPAPQAATYSYGPTEATRVDGRPTNGVLDVSTLPAVVTVPPYAMVEVVLRPASSPPATTPASTSATPSSTATPTPSSTAMPTPSSTATPTPTPGVGGVTVSAPLALSGTSVTAGGMLSGAATLRNSGSSAVTLPEIVIAARPPGGTHAGGPYDDFGKLQNVTLQPGASVTIRESRTFNASDPIGVWTAYLTYEDAAGTYHDQAPDLSFSVVPSSTPTPPTATAVPVTNTPTATATALSGGNGVTAGGSAAPGGAGTGEDDVTVTTTATLTKLSLTIVVAGPNVINPRGAANTIANTTLTTTNNPDGGVTYVYTLNQGATMAPGSGMLAARFDFSNGYGLTHRYAGDTYSLTTTTSSGASSTITGHF